MPTASTITLPVNSMYDQAVWKDFPELEKMEKMHRRPPWVAGVVGLQTKVLFDWANFLENGGQPAPLHILAKHDDPVWHDRLGGTSLAEKREIERRSSFSIIRSQMEAEKRSNMRQSVTNTNDITTNTVNSLQMPTLASHLSSPQVKDRNRHNSVVIDIPPPPPLDLKHSSDSNKDGNYNGSSSSSSDDSQNRSSGTYHVSVSSYDPALYHKQCKDIEASLAHVRVHGIYIERSTAAAYGMSVMASGLPTSFIEQVRVASLDPEGAIALNGAIRINDRILKINGQWIVNVKHCNSLLGATSSDRSLDIAITRGEPLPNPPDIPFQNMSNDKLHELAYTHYGVRISSDEATWSRDSIIMLVSSRFASKTGTKSTELAIENDTRNGIGNIMSTVDTGQIKLNDSTQSSDTAPTFILPKSALRRSALSDSNGSVDNNNNGSSSLRQKKSVKFSSQNPKVLETYSKSDYTRPLDPGKGFSDLRALFNFNTDKMEQEQTHEAEAYIEHRRMYGHYILRNNTSHPIGFKLRAIPKDLSQRYIYLEGVEIYDIDPKSPAGKHGGILEGDRLVKVNGQWILNHQHAEYLIFDVLRRAKAFDLTVTRDEPLAPIFDLSDKSDDELLDLAFEHGGYRVAIGAGQCTREQVQRMIQKRLSGKISPVHELQRTHSMSSRHEDQNC